MIDVGTDPGQMGFRSQPGSLGFATEPVRINFRDAGIKIDQNQLRSEDEQAPVGDSAGQFGFEANSVGRPAMMSRNQGQQHGEEANQVKMIEVMRFLEKKHIGESDTENTGGDAIEQPDRHEKSAYAQDAEVPVHAVAGPAIDKRQKGKQELGFHVGLTDEIEDKIPPDFVEENQAKTDAEDRQRSAIDWASEILEPARGSRSLGG